MPNHPPTPPPPPTTSLKPLLSHIAHQQSLLNTLHPTARAAPLLAFALAGLVKQRTGVDFLGDGLLGGGGGEDHELMIELDAPPVERPERTRRQRNVNLNGGRIWESCGNCLDGDRRRRGGEGEG